MNKRSVKEQIVSLKDSEGRVVEEKEICKMLNANFQSFFTEYTLLPSLIKLDGDESVESIEVVKNM